MRGRRRRQARRLASMILCMAVGGALALMIYPALPVESRERAEAFRHRIMDEAQPPGIDARVEEAPPVTVPALWPTPSIPAPALSSTIQQPTGTPMVTATAAIDPPPSPTSSPRPTPTPTLIPTPTRTPTRTPTPTSAPTPIPTPIVTFIPTPTVRPMTLQDQRVYLLKLINADRVSHRLTPVTLGYNTAAQDHAEEMLEYSYVAHWGLDGMKPYMRYTLTGGMSYSSENALGIDRPLLEDANYPRIHLKRELRDAEESLMDSPGHRDNILYPWHTTVNLGIACSEYTCAVVQQFAGDYVAFDPLPTISAGLLNVQGTRAGGFTIDQVSIWYDRTPHEVTIGQLDRTNCYSLGETPVAFVQAPAPPGSFYPPVTSRYTWESCPSPYHASPTTRRLEGYEVYMPMPLLYGAKRSPWLTAQTWVVEGSSFRIEVDLQDILAEMGAGVYTVLVWGSPMDEDVGLANDSVVLTEFAIFVE